MLLPYSCVKVKKWSGERSKSHEKQHRRGRDWVLHGVKLQGKRAFVVIEGHYDRSRANISLQGLVHSCSLILWPLALWYMCTLCTANFQPQFWSFWCRTINKLDWQLTSLSAWAHHYPLWDIGHGRRSMTIKGAQNWKWTLPRNNLTFSSRENCDTEEEFKNLVQLRFSQPA